MPTLLAKNITWLMDKHRVESPSALSRATSVPQPTIHRMLSGEAKQPRHSTLKQIADYFGVDPSYMMDKDLAQLGIESNVSPIKLTSVKVPLISWVRAGNLSDVVDNHRPGEADEWIAPEYTKPSKHAFALRVEGDSMTGGSNGVNFPEGCLIIVDPERSPQAGDYVVAKDTTTQKATFKKLTTDGASWYLKPLNPAYPTKEIDDPAVRVIGVVIEWQIGGKL